MNENLGSLLREVSEFYATLHCAHVDAWVEWVYEGGEYDQSEDSFPYDGDDE